MWDCWHPKILSRLAILCKLVNKGVLNPAITQAIFAARDSSYSLHNVNKLQVSEEENIEAVSHGPHFHALRKTAIKNIKEK